MGTKSKETQKQQTGQGTKGQKEKKGQEFIRSNPNEAMGQHKYNQGRDPDLGKVETGQHCGSEGQEKQPQQQQRGQSQPARQNK
ncbi:MAG TPA: hypothetical protein VHD36_20610 [Pirellulales bacterium]|nr:hypothetical protein [Pirellulales bacterium]